MADFLPPGGPTEVAFRATGQTITESGVSAEFMLRRWRNVWIAAFIGDVTGDTPSITFYLEQQDANGHWIVTTQIGVAITSAPNYTSGYAGDAAGGMLAGRARISWVVTGTTPSFESVDLSVIGRWEASHADRT
jgi:hypothetical protein